MKVFYSRDYVAGSDGFDTTSKAQAVAESLVQRPMPGVQLVEPEPVDRAQLLAAHSDECVEAVATGQPEQLAGSSGSPGTKAHGGASAHRSAVLSVP